MGLIVKYRPGRFEEIFGQSKVVSAVKGFVVRYRKKKELPNLLLFAGPSGVGKTTLARLFIKGLNCERFGEDVCGECASCNAIEAGIGDLLEIDGATARGIDNIRGLKHLVMYPSFGKVRGIVIDEAHQLTKDACSALLKMIEDFSGKNVVFVLVTTNPEFLPRTILDRAVKVFFERPSAQVLKDFAIFVAEREGLGEEQRAILLDRISRMKSFRDVLTYIEMMNVSGEAEVYEDVEIANFVNDFFALKRVEVPFQRLVYSGATPRELIFALVARVVEDYEAQRFDFEAFDTLVGLLFRILEIGQNLDEMLVLLKVAQIYLGNIYGRGRSGVISKEI